MTPSETRKRLALLHTMISGDSDIAYRLNRGGCAFFAALVGRYFKHVVGCAVLHQFERGVDKDAVMEDINANIKLTDTSHVLSAHNVACDHVVAQFDFYGRRYMFDGVYGLRSWKSLRETIRFSELACVLPVMNCAEIAKTRKGWNYVFHSQRGIKKRVYEMVKHAATCALV